MSDDRLTAIRARIGEFPKTPGVYLMKDGEGRVLYVGKAKDLRARASSYFQPGADLLNTRGPDICRMVENVVEIDVIECESEIDAIIKEARLIKDIQPPHNVMLKDDKTFPYIEITTRDDFPGVFVTRTPRLKGSKLYGPFPSASAIRDAVNALQKAFKFRTCELDIREDDESRRFFRPCLLHAINQCTAPCAALISKEEYRKDVDRLKRFLNSKRTPLIRQLTRNMEAASADKRFEDAAKLRDQLKAIQSLALSGDVTEDVQPEVFFVDPTKGLEKLADLLGFESPPRCMECMDIAHLRGTETVGSLVCFVDGRPFKPGYRRFKIKAIQGSAKGIDERNRDRAQVSHAREDKAKQPPSISKGDKGRVVESGSAAERHDLTYIPLVDGEEAPTLSSTPPEASDEPPPVPRRDGGGLQYRASPGDDYAAIREVIRRRYRYAAEGEELYPDVILIDGGLGQLHAGMDVFSEMNVRPPMVIALAKREEELYIQARSAPIRLSRNNEALRILQHMRDEAHRFAQHYHHTLRKKRTLDDENSEGRRPPTGKGRR